MEFAGERDYRTGKLIIIKDNKFGAESILEMLDRKLRLRLGNRDFSPSDEA